MDGLTVDGTPGATVAGTSGTTKITLLISSLFNTKLYFEFFKIIEY